MIVIALGANMSAHIDGEEVSPAETVRRAISVLDRLFTVSHISSLYQSPAWPDPADPPFINAVVASEKTLPPQMVIKALHSTELAFGRVRGLRNAPRSLDLDLLAIDDLIVEPDHEDGLTLPHPRIEERAFVLVPLAQILPDWLHPITQNSASELLKQLGEVEIEAYSE